MFWLFKKCLYVCSVINDKKTEKMTTLTNKLRQETESLKVQFIALNADWAKKEFERLENLFDATTYEIGAVLGFESKEIEKFGTKRTTWKNNNFYNTSDAKTLKNFETKIRNAKNLGLDKFIDNAKKAAEEKYNHSIEKLSARIEKKQLNEESLKIKTAHVGVNIETVLTDGNKTVRAFTIIAHGEVQKPHYRYLVN